MNGLKWSKMDKAAARQAFDLAYQRECATLASKLKEMIEDVKGPADIWGIHDFLSKQRKKTDEKYDFRYSVLVFVLAMLLKERWLEEADLDGLGEDKIEKIKYLAAMEG